MSRILPAAALFLAAAGAAVNGKDVVASGLFIEGCVTKTDPSQKLDLRNLRKVPGLHGFRGGHRQSHHMALRFNVRIGRRRRRGSFVTLIRKEPHFPLRERKTQARC
ncbi:MAG TPA: hypothetical protein VLV89_08795, partial [Candidatus Acidoferrum sp.]|nr:hypothetical protein [Candidatus Acidoferrum sp.]